MPPSRSIATDSVDVAPTSAVDAVVTPRWSFPAVLLLADLTFLCLGGAVGGLWGGFRPAGFIVAATVLIMVGRYRYRWRFTLSALDDIPTILAAVAVATLTGFVAFAFLVRGWPETRVLGTLQAGFVILVFGAVGRVVACAAVRALRRRGVGVARAVIVGTGGTAGRIADVLSVDAALGVRVLGFVDDVRAPVDRGPLLGTVEALPCVVRDMHAELVLIAHGASSYQSVVDPVRALGGASCEVFVVPRLYELHDGSTAGDLLDGLPVVRLRRLAFRSPSWRFKRVMDVVLAAVSLVVVSPVMAIVAVAVRLETGSVLYRQERIGRLGRPFMLYKFCSLRPDGDEGRTRWSIDDDPRVGPVGVLIRATSLDELPQLVNVLRGDMSLVGPRPERAHFVEQFSSTVPGYRFRHRMPVGLTGLAVIHGLRGDTEIDGRANFDNMYAESWSLWLDVKIILATAVQLVSRVPWRKILSRARRGARVEAPSSGQTR